jgi:hypothetical protein
MNAKTTTLTAEAVALVQQAAEAMCKALETLHQANGRPLTVADLHALTGPTLRAGTSIKRANQVQQNNA